MWWLGGLTAPVLVLRSVSYVAHQGNRLLPYLNDLACLNSGCSSSEVLQSSLASLKLRPEFGCTLFIERSSRSFQLYDLASDLQDVTAEVEQGSLYTS